MKTIYDLRECGCPAAITTVPPRGMVSVLEALSSGKARTEQLGADAEIVKVTDGAVCGMPRPEKQKAEI